MRRKPLVWTLPLTLLILLALSVPAVWASHPGDVDLDGLERSLGLPAQQLDFDRQALLSLVDAMGATSPELRELLDSVERVRARFYALDDWRQDEVRERIASVVDGLKDDGWSTLVQVRDGADNVHVLLRLDGDLVVGLVALAINGEQAGYFHLMGEIDPAEAMAALVHGHGSLQQVMSGIGGEN